MSESLRYVTDERRRDLAAAELRGGCMTDITTGRLEALLQLWGHVYGESRQEWDEPHGCSPIAKLQRPSRDARHVPQAWMRGRGRLTTMGAAADLRAVPTWAADPVVCSETRSQSAPRHDRRETPEVIAVQDAWLALRRWHARHAEIVRVQYQVRGLTQTDKARGLGISRRQYQELLTSGRLWIHARVAA